MFQEDLKKLEYFRDKDLIHAFDSLTHTLVREQVVGYAKDLITKNIPFSIALIDIDNFKYINDNYGHMIGDDILEEIAKAMMDSLQEKAVIGRYGGDEFIAVFPNITDYDEIWKLLHELNLDVCKKVYGGIEQLSISITTGVSRFDLDATDFDTLIQMADKALYRGKTKGRNCFIIFLKEKHMNIELKTEKETVFSSMDMHSQIFRYLTRNHNLKRNIKMLLQYLSSYLMIDHLCIQVDNETYFDVVHPLSQYNSFGPIDYKLISNNFNSNGLLYLNKTNILKRIDKLDTYMELRKQKIDALTYCTIESFGNQYGILRADMTKNRIWQTGEMDLLITTARVIGILLAYEGKTIEKL